MLAGTKGLREMFDSVLKSNLAGIVACTHRNTNMHARPWEEGAFSSNSEAKHLPNTGSQFGVALGRGSQFVSSQGAFPDLPILVSAVS